MSPTNPGTRKPSSPRADEPPPRARLTLHEVDPITGNEDTLSSLFYEEHRGCTIYSTPRGRCCIHGKHGCLKLRGKFVCFYDIEEAKTFIRCLRRAGYTSSDSVERYVPQEQYVWLNWRKQQPQRRSSRPMQPVS